MTDDPREVPYDSTLDTLRHSRRVDELLLQVITELQERLHKHDQSKLEPPEKAIFDEYTPKLAAAAYDSVEYRRYLAEMKVALDHHYANNRHHPEHRAGGVNDMTLVDVAEMLCDWKAATERQSGGDLAKGLKIQRRRFGLSDQLVAILANTANEFGWLASSEPPTLPPALGADNGVGL